MNRIQPLLRTLTAVTVLVASAACQDCGNNPGDEDSGPVDITTVDGGGEVIDATAADHAQVQHDGATRDSDLPPGDATLQDAASRDTWTAGSDAAHATDASTPVDATAVDGATPPTDGATPPTDGGGLTDLGPSLDSGASTQDAAGTLLAPTGVSAVGGNRTITVTWQPVGGATRYRLFYNTSPGVEVGAAASQSNVQSPFVHSNLDDGTTYFYRVRAENDQGVGPLSLEVFATTEHHLAAPTNLVAEGLSRMVRLTWDPVTNATSYTLYYSAVPGVTPTTGSALPSATSPYTHGGLDGNKTYYYVVVANALNGQSPPSDEASATTLNLEVEPNDELDPDLVDMSTFYATARANRLFEAETLGGTVQGGSRPDVDWYQVLPMQDGVLSLALDADSVAGADLDLAIVDAASFLPIGFAGEGRRTGSDEQLSLPVYFGNTYYVVVYDFEWSGHDVAYELKTGFASAALDPADNNDSPYLATELSIGAASELTRTGLIDRQGDVDFFIITDPDPDLMVKAELTPPAGTALGLFEYNLDPVATPAWTVESGTTFTPPVDAVLTLTNGKIGTLPLDQVTGVIDSAFKSPWLIAVMGAQKSRPYPGDELAAQRFTHGTQTYSLRLHTSPASPATVQVEVLNHSSGQVMVSWSPSVGATAYDIFEATHDDVDSGDQVFAGVTTPFVQAGFGGGPHYFRVAARNAIGSSAGSPPQLVEIVIPDGG